MTITPTNAFMMNAAIILRLFGVILFILGVLKLSVTMDGCLSFAAIPHQAMLSVNDLIDFLSFDI